MSKRPMNYTNRDFETIKSSLVNYARRYYANTYQDFNESSPGMMFIEMASYVGDVLSYYVDSQFKEMLLAYAEDTKAIYDMAQSFGYKPKLSRPSFASVDVFQTVPSTVSAQKIFQCPADHAYTIATVPQRPCQIVPHPIRSTLFHTLVAHNVIALCCIVELRCLPCARRFHYTSCVRRVRKLLCHVSKCLAWHVCLHYSPVHCRPS